MAHMNIPLDIELLSPKEGISPIFLSVGYGNAHIVIEVSGPDAIDRWLSFIFAHRDERGAHWVEVGRYVTLPVSFTMSSDLLSLGVDSDLTVDGFGQSVGLYIPRELLDSFIDGLAREHRKYVEKPTA
jgi:hypothetical protein